MAIHATTKEYPPSLDCKFFVQHVLIVPQLWRDPVMAWIDHILAGTKLTWDSDLQDLVPERMLSWFSNLLKSIIYPSNIVKCQSYIGWDHLNLTWSQHSDYTALCASTHHMSLKEKAMKPDNLGDSGAYLMSINHTNIQIKIHEENSI